MPTSRTPRVSTSAWATSDPGGTHVGFTAPDADAVRAFYDAASRRAHGQRPARPPSAVRQHYYAAYVLDADGNNIEAVPSQQ